MVIRRGLGYFIILSLGFVFSLYSVYSACDTSPQNISVTSGGIYVGTFSLGEQIFVKSDLTNNPLTLSFLFHGSQEDCINGSDIKYSLRSDSGFRNFDTFSSSKVDENLYVFTASFTLSGVTFSNSITPYYEMSTSDGKSGRETITILKDDTGPEIGINYNEKDVYGDNEMIEFNINVGDSGVGLSRLNLLGGDSRIIDYEGNSSDVVIYNDTPSSSKTYTFRAEDVLGNINEKNVSIVVDSDSPEILINERSRRIDYSDSKRYFFISATVSDDSVAFGREITVFGDFSEINPSKNRENGNCQNSGSSSNSIICSWRIEVSLDETADVTVNIFAEDEFEHNSSSNHNSQVFIDNEGPEITDFYLENRLGVRNILSSEDRNASIFVRFRDASLPDNVEDDMNSNIDFGLLGIHPPNPTCSSEGDDVFNCTYYLRTSPQVYRGHGSYQDNYTITLYDEFGNSNSDTFTVEIDNINPVIDRIVLEEVGTDINDKIITSGQSIEFEVYINDSNLDNNGEYFVFGDLSSIVTSNDMDNVGGSCSVYSEVSYECSFSGISVGNGYFKENVSFLVFDAAGNGVREMYEIEVLRVGNEVSSSFRIPDLKILNPIHREHIRLNSIKAWFKGSIERISNNNDSMRIVNYQIIGGSCNVSQLDPLIISELPKLFPREVVYFGDQEDIFEFAVESELGSYNGFSSHLNDEKMRCTMSISKRDDTTFYDSELVNFSLEYSFYGDYRVEGNVDNLLVAHAEDILSDIESVKYLGGWFDKIWGVYKLLDNFCSGITSVSGAVSIVTSTLHGTSMILKGFVVTYPIGEAIDTISMPTQGVISTLFGENSFVQNACGWVTCEQGGTLSFLDTQFDTEISNVLGGDSVINNLNKINDRVSMNCNINIEGGNIR